MVKREENMKVTIIGTGKMARALSIRLLEGGNQVTLVGHTPGKAEELVAELEKTVKSSGSISSAKGKAITGEVAILAIPYSATTEVTDQFGDQLVGKIVVDITNPINFQTMQSAVENSSGAEEIAKHLSVTSRVVKAFNTTLATPLTSGQVGGLPLDVFIAGDDAQARAIVSELVESGGMRPIDAGPLARARQLEALGLLHIALQSQRNTNFMNAIKVID
jgi:8-hydroxy-5-deazaflavin:NADPH oxidoreductase